MRCFVPFSSLEIFFMLIICHEKVNSCRVCVHEISLELIYGKITLKNISRMCLDSSAAILQVPYYVTVTKQIYKTVQEPHYVTETKIEQNYVTETLDEPHYVTKTNVQTKQQHMYVTVTETKHGYVTITHTKTEPHYTTVCNYGSSGY